MAAEYSSCQETIMKRNEENGTINGGFGFEFDPSAPPPFKIAEIRAAIPTHCWVKNPWRSLSYVLRDALLVISLAAFALHLNNWLFWPFYWLAQGTMFWAIFVLGHDCGHGSFSNNPTLNSVVGHLLHSSILVPYNGWRISHRTHHQNHGNVENDESWVPLSEELYKNLNLRKKIMRFTLPFPMLAYPLYLWTRGPGKHGSHFNPKSNLFAPNERKAVITSTICWTAMLLLLFYASFAFGPLKVLTLYGLPYLYNRTEGVFHTCWTTMLLLLFYASFAFGPLKVLTLYGLPYLGVFRTCWTAMLLLLFYASIVFGPLKVLTLYGLPYLIFVVWLDFVTYLHHHGYQQKLPWYRGKEWSYLRGGLTTVDRDYGWINNIHHDIGTHVIHHLFPQIPHYHLVEATKAAKPVLGKFYREPKQSGPFPLHLLSDLVRSISQDHYVSNTGDIVYYQTDPTLLKSSKTN